jgi:uncharacterized membrane protein YgcG
MRRNMIRTWTCALVACCGLAGLALAASFVAFRADLPAPVLNTVKDQGEFFSKDAIDKANDEILFLNRYFKKDIVVETFKSLPADTDFAKLLSERSAASKGDGVHILICREPSKLQIGASEETYKKGLSRDDVGKMRDVMIARFRDKEYDKGLAEGLQVVRERFLANLPPPAPVLNAVRDYARFFKGETVQKVGDEIRELARQYHKDVVIETFPRLPVDTDFAKLLSERSAASKGDGVYILISREPSKIQVGASDNLRKTVFPDPEVAKLREVLLTGFREKEYDKGLTDAAQLIRSQYSKLMPDPILNVVKDYAGFFSKEAVERANKVLDELHARSKKDVVFETFASLPADTDFPKLLSERSAKARGDGVHVLICKEPSKVQVGASENVLKGDFPAAEVTKLRDLLIDNFKSRDYDKGLADSVQLLRNRLGRYLPDPILNVVKDYAGFFSPGAIESANKEIEQIRQRYKKDVVIETFASVPSDTDFAKLLAERSVKAKGDGVHILICKEPSKVQVGASDNVLKGELPAAEVTKLRDLLIDNFKSRDYDKGLADAVQLLRNRLGRYLPDPVLNVVKDHAGFFSAGAVESANKEIEQFRQRYKKDVVIETFASVPNDTDFAKLLSERSAKAKGDGVHILISKEPPRIQVGASDDTLKTDLPGAEVAKLREVLSENFREKEYDKGLGKAIAFLNDAMRAPTVKDDGKFFSDSAVTKANDMLREIRRKYQREILVETFKEVPENRARGFDLDKDADKRKCFETWGAERAKAAGKNGISILATKKPGRLEVTTDTEDRVIGSTERGKVAQIMLDAFRESRFDDGLLKALEYLNETLRR